MDDGGAAVPRDAERVRAGARATAAAASSWRDPAQLPDKIDFRRRSISSRRRHATRARGRLGRDGDGILRHHRRRFKRRSSSSAGRLSRPVLLRESPILRTSPDLRAVLRRPRGRKDAPQRTHPRAHKGASPPFASATGEFNPPAAGEDAVSIGETFRRSRLLAISSESARFVPGDAPNARVGWTSSSGAGGGLSRHAHTQRVRGIGPIHASPRRPGDRCPRTASTQRGSRRARARPPAPEARRAHRGGRGRGGRERSVQGAERRGGVARRRRVVVVVRRDRGVKAGRRRGSGIDRPPSRGSYAMPGISSSSLEVHAAATATTRGRGRVGRGGELQGGKHSCRSRTRGGSNQTVQYSTYISNSAGDPS